MARRRVSRRSEERSCESIALADSYLERSNRNDYNGSGYHRDVAYFTCAFVDDWLLFRPCLGRRFEADFSSARMDEGRAREGWLFEREAGGVAGLAEDA